MSVHPATFRAFSPIRASAVPISMAAVIFSQLAPDASAADYTWTQTVGGAQNWADGTNWDGGSAPSPVSGDSVDFSTVDILANTTLTLGATRTATTWKFGDTSGAQTWTVSGNSLTLAGAGASIEVGTATTIGSVFSVSNGTTATATGNGALTLDNASFKVGGTAANTTQTLDLSDLGSFTYENSSGAFSVGGQLSGNNLRTIGTLTLSADSSFTAATFGVANVSNGGNSSQTNNTNLGTLNLTGATTINTGAITVGANQANGVIQYVSGTTDPTFTIRGTDGLSAATSMLVGQGGGNGNGYTTSSGVDLVAGVTGTSTLDAKIGTLTIGHCNRGSTASGNGGTVNGTFTMGAGTLTVDTMVLGSTTTFGNTGNTQTVNGTFTTGAGGVVNVGSLQLVNQINTTGTVKLNGVFNLNGGADLYATTIGPGSTTAGTVTRNFNWNDGTIHNLAGTDLTIGTGVTWILASTGTHAFDIENGRAGTVNAVLAGTGGTLTKTGEGTLTLNGTNSYSGATNVNQGTLLVDGAPTGAGDITVADTGRLGGNGSAANAAVIVETGGGLSLDISDWTGEAGTGFSDLDVQSLDLPDGAWVIDVGSTASYANFSEAPVTFPMLNASSGIDGFNAANVTVVAGDAFPGTGTWSVQVTGNTLELAYSPGAGSDYSNWAAGYEEYDLSDPQADLDGDGMTNWQEYAFGLNPTSGASVNPILSIADLKTLGQFTYTRRYNSGLTYSVYTSTDLKTWEWINPLLFSEEAESPVAGVQSVLIELTGFEPPNTLFLRVAAD